jgi:hypothetical protein
MEILDVKYGGNFVFNKEKTNYHPKATQDQDGFKTATVEMKFKIKNITATGWRGKANIHIHVTDVDTGEDFTMTQKNIPALLFLVNNKIDTATFIINSNGLNIDSSKIGWKNKENI